ncbi:PCAF-associated factor 65-alpha [Macaca fascicularis]|uniref:PCAF-associated factor 65-alpha n=1 Tax=Macaca fascicularis TaxID=9541 RepID=G7PPS9_MACFA|nr:PCAF-associated factor 65-alpha [Macaca fascicularis]
MSEREERRFVEIPRESVRLMAESTGLELSDEVAALLAEDVCYRLREATQVALQDLQTNSKIGALLPYFVYVVSGVKSVSHDLEQLHRLLQVARSLFRNPHLCLGPYVRCLVGSVLYCVLEPLAASINPLNDHWTLRDGAALLLSHITHGDLVSGLYQHILLSLQKILADPVRPLCCHYGAVVGLHALGWKAVERVLYPHLSTYWTNLQAVLDDYSVSNAQVKADGHKVYGAILVAVERLLKMKAQAAEPNRGGPGGRGCRRLDDLPWDSLLLQESSSGGGAEPSFGSGLPLPPGGAGQEDPSLSVTLADIYRELYAFFGDSLATRFGTGPQGDESPRGSGGSGPTSASGPAASESRPLPRVHRARGAPRQQGPGTGTRDVFQKSRFAPRGAPHFRFIIAGRQLSDYSLYLPL